jgi:endogenous inhibitor of DNA gyrase (YacG/DUF329 family)
MAKPELLASPKLRKLVRKLALPKAHVVGLLEIMWHSGYSAKTDVLGDVDDVEVAAEWEGEPGKLAEVLAAERWIDFDETLGAYRIHDFSDHAPAYVVKSMEDAHAALKTCKECGAQFRQRDARQVFCSSRCRTAAWRKSTAETQSDAEVRHGDGRETLCDAPPYPPNPYQTIPPHPIPTPRRLVSNGRQTTRSKGRGAGGRM